MAARAALHSLIAADPVLLAIGLEKVYATNSVDTPLEQFFIVVRWDNLTRAFKAKGSHRVSVWVLDKQRDYGRINKALERLKELLPSTVHREGSDGWIFTLAEWEGEGPDLVDGGFHTITRYADFTVVSRYNTT